MKVLIGTRNPHKLAEILRILGQIPGIEWVTFRELPFPAIEEWGATLEENAALKASRLVELIGLSTLAEDSGLWVMALGGAPGVRSARFAGSASARGIKPPSARGIKSDEPIPQAEEPETKDRIIPQAKDYTANNRELLSRLSGQKDRRARFRTVAVLALPDGRAWKTEGILAGHISEAPRGRGGFGYDPVFIPEGETRTLAELCPEEKDAISHRRLALEQLRPILATLTTDRDLRPSPKD